MGRYSECLRFWEKKQTGLCADAVSECQIERYRAEGVVSASCPADGAADGVCGQNGARPRYASNELLCERGRAVSVCNVSTFSSSAYGRLVVTLACAVLFSRRGDVAQQVRLEALSASGGRDGQCGTRQRRRQPPKV